MNQDSSQSYLDLSVLPTLRACVLSNEPVVVFSRNLDDIIWSNAAGARLFGGTGIAEILAMAIPTGHPILVQLKNAVGRLEVNHRITRGVRVGRSLRSQLLQFEIHHIELPGDQTGYKVTHLLDTGETAMETELAEQAIVSLTDFADAAAIVDDVGQPLFASPDFTDLAPDTDELGAMITELKSETDRLIKRPYRLSDDNIVAIGLARLNDMPGRNLVVLAQTANEEVEEEENTSVTETAETDRHPDIPTDAISENTDDPAEADLHEASNEPETGEEELTAPSERTEETQSPAKETSQQDAPDLPEEADEETLSDDVRPIGVPAGETSQPGFIRFAWNIDENGTFTSVSDELAEVVGAKPADIVGRRWSDISKILGFDRDEEIEKLLGQRDTWSGKTVLWPVEGTDEIVPVDLAALPIFGTDRTFKGFRGYGKILASERLKDPEAIGMAFAETSVEFGQEEETEASDDEPEIKILGNNEETHGEPEVSSGETTGASNVLPFSRNQDSESAETLNENERNALEAVREHLREEGLEQEPVSEIDTSPNVDTSLLEKL
ncbi:MAG: PAS domain-containing protein, partial [Pseudomonadota bacterium]